MEIHLEWDVSFVRVRCVMIDMCCQECVSTENNIYIYIYVLCMLCVLYGKAFISTRLNVYGFFVYCKETHLCIVKKNTVCQFKTIDIVMCVSEHQTNVIFEMVLL